MIRKTAYPLTVLVVFFLIHFTVVAVESVPSYNKALNQFMQQSKKAEKKSGFTPAEYKLMGDAAKKVAAKLPEPGLKPGTRAPAFNLPNANGKKISLATYLKKGPVILVFYRGAWCPFCNLQLNTYSKSMPQFKKYKANMIAITPQKPDKSLGQIKKSKLEFEVLSDLDSSVMKAYKLYFKVPPELVKLYKAKGLNLDDFNGKGRHVLPAPGVLSSIKKALFEPWKQTPITKNGWSPQLS